jgi:hypothetical protein
MAPGGAQPQGSVCPVWLIWLPSKGCRRGEPGKWQALAATP